jgi:hypothetical protein
VTLRRTALPIPGKRERHAAQRRQRLAAGFLHDRRTMVFHGSLTDAKIESDILAGASGKNQSKYLAFPLSKASIVELAAQLILFMVQRAVQTIIIRRFVIAPVIRNGRFVVRQRVNPGQ